VVHKRRRSRAVLEPAGVSQRHERVSPQIAGVVPGDVEAVVATDQLVAVRAQPLDQRNVRLRTLGQARVGAPFLDATVPRADVLADVAAVDLCAELTPVVLRYRRRRLRPVRETLRRVEYPGLVERAGGAGL